jgi:hypothetical protein
MEWLGSRKSDSISPFNVKALAEQQGPWQPNAIPRHARSSPSRARLAPSASISTVNACTSISASVQPSQSEASRRASPAGAPAGRCRSLVGIGTSYFIDTHMPVRLIFEPQVTSASLIGRLGSSAFRLSTNSSVDVAHGLSLLFGLGTKGPSIMGFEDEVEQSFGRPCRQCDGRFKRTYELTSSIVPRGTSFHRGVELDFLLSHLILHSSQATATSLVHRNSVPSTHMRCMITAKRRASATIAFFIPRCPGDLHRPGLEPGPFCRTYQHALGRFVEHHPHHLVSTS